MAQSGKDAGAAVDVNVKVPKAAKKAPAKKAVKTQAKKVEQKNPEGKKE